MDKQLSENIKQQTNKLLQQLEELEELKDELEPEELEELKKETLEQLQEFQAGLTKMESNNLSLNDEINQAKLELQNAIKKAFNKDELKQNLMQGESVGLRDQIKKLERDHDLGKVQKQQFIQQKLSLINHLIDLKQQLSEDEQKFLELHTGKNAFQEQNEAPTDNTHDNLINQASQQVNKL